MKARSRTAPNRSPTGGEKHGPGGARLELQKRTEVSTSSGDWLVYDGVTGRLREDGAARPGDVLVHVGGDGHGSEG